MGIQYKVKVVRKRMLTKFFAHGQLTKYSKKVTLPSLVSIRYCMDSIPSTLILIYERGKKKKNGGRGVDMSSADIHKLHTHTETLADKRSARSEGLISFILYLAAGNIQ